MSGEEAKEEGERRNDQHGGSEEIFVASRRSKLALVQTNLVIDLLSAQYPTKVFTVLEKTTMGDKVLDVSLSKIGEKGLFTKELEVSLLEKETDFAVHSLKDMPTKLPAGLSLGAISKRQHYLDIVIVNQKNKGHTLSTLGEGSVIGTSSLRRIAQLKRAFPHLQFKDVRGNLQTRLNKLENFEEFGYDALILAEAGIRRLNLDHLIHEVIPPSICFPAVGQGALAIECREGDEKTLSIISIINDYETQLCCEAERAFMRSLEGGCQVPIAAFTEIDNASHQFTIKGKVLSVDGSECVESSISSDLFTIENARKIGEELAEVLKQNGAMEILHKVYNRNNDI